MLEKLFEKFWFGDKIFPNWINWTTFSLSIVIINFFAGFISIYEWIFEINSVWEGIVVFAIGCGILYFCVNNIVKD